MNVSENENEFVISAEVPGCEADDVDIAVRGNTLTITGERKQEEGKEKRGYRHTECSYGSFSRYINLPFDIAPGKIEAFCRDGVLTVKLPKNRTDKGN